LTIFHRENETADPVRVQTVFLGAVRNSPSLSYSGKEKPRPALEGVTGGVPVKDSAATIQSARELGKTKLARRHRARIALERSRRA